MQRVAIIDDTIEILNLVEKALVRSGYFSEVEKFSDPVAGFREITKGKFDIVVLDIQMPRLDGLSVLKKIRSYQNLNRVKVFMITGNSTVNRILQADQLGADGYIRKPFKNLMDLPNQILN